MPREIYNMTFTPAMFDRPILQTLGKRFRLQLNIRRAILSEDGGWAEVAFDGPAEEIGRALADLQTTGVNTTGPITDLVEPDLDFIPTPVGRGT